MAHLRDTALAAQALDLPPSERAQLVCSCLICVEPDHAEIWPESLVAELRRRSDELRSGRVKGLTSEEVFGEPL